VRPDDLPARTATWRRWPLPLISLVVASCSLGGAPSFAIAGAYFPAWMACALLGIVTAIVARIVFVATGLATILPFQLFVCTSIGCWAAFLAWLLWFGR
jgi:hypothetical protein